jgi:23S rRNA pseudouridine2605 synthase
VVLEDGFKTSPANITVESEAGKGTWLRVTMGEGRKRQIREVGMQLGLPVVRIVRTRIASLRLGNLKPGAWRHLTESEVAELQGKKPASKAAHSLPKSRKSLSRKGIHHNGHKVHKG